MIAGLLFINFYKAALVVKLVLFLPLAPPESSSVAKEFDDSMRSAATALIPADSCVFDDILEIWGDPREVKEVLNNCEGYENKLKQSASLPIYSHAWCHKHQNNCHLGTGKPRVQGPPCPDWSSAGLKKGLEGVHLACALAGGAKARATLSPAVVVENVPRMPQFLLEDSYGPEMNWAKFIVCPGDVGFEMIARERRGSKFCRGKGRQTRVIQSPKSKNHALARPVRAYFAGINTQVGEISGDFTSLLEEVHAKLRRERTLGSGAQTANTQGPMAISPFHKQVCHASCKGSQ